jgi:hypothetical protein
MEVLCGERQTVQQFQIAIYAESPANVQQHLRFKTFRIPIRRTLLNICQTLQFHRPGAIFECRKPYR